MLLVQRVSSVNATLGETTGADVSDVRLAVGGDGHVRVAFLNAGVGFGWPSMQKDVLLLGVLAAGPRRDSASSGSLSHPRLPAPGHHSPSPPRRLLFSSTLPRRRFLAR
jgi:hypothetical protein